MVASHKAATKMTHTVAKWPCKHMHMPVVQFLRFLDNDSNETFCHRVCHRDLGSVSFYSFSALLPLSKYLKPHCTVCEYGILAYDIFASVFED